MRWNRGIVLFVPLALACGDGEPADSTPQADTTGMAAAEEEIPTRTAETARDQGSRPQEVMDFVGIGSGDQVADLIAGNGYYTYLLSERVGPTGRVYAQGYSPGLEARVARGDLSQAENVVLVDSLGELPAGTLDAVLLIRAFHLFEEPAVLFAALDRALKPGGTIGVVELRLGQDYGHDMETHRMGDQTVIDEFHAAGFELLETSDALRNPEDDHTDFWEGRRHLADRMLLKFGKPGEPAPTTPPTAQRTS
ncbi:MAG TPA: methyltransferase domain-containing protein [Gemmatimonadota bacterium]|nr:methyltransferase domain-containing protein [Gemmatimonadota bacterium]